MKLHFRSTTVPTGLNLLRDPLLNKGMAFTDRERDLLGIRGLLPPHIHTQEEQVMRVLANYRAKGSDMEKYLHLISLQDRNETLFYRLLFDNLEEMMPIIYTPTVGKACQQYGHIFMRPRGIYVSSKDHGSVAEVLRNWPREDVRIIVVTDGERILGLGDLGAHGMGIPVGKLSLYTACAGIHPSQCLPILLDVGTDTQWLLDDPLYIGVHQKRLRGQAYDDLVEEFIMAVQDVFPHALVQFEDFGNSNAFRLLDRYRDRVLCFNDDIQGTGAVVLAGMLSALRIRGGKLKEQMVLFAGAGGAATGIADMVVAAMMEEGASESEARAKCWFFDTKGLVVKTRNDLAGHKKRYAHDHRPVSDFLEAVNDVKPSAIVGATGHTGTFSRAVLEAMASFNDRPIVFALSNPTSKAECTAEEAYTFTGGRAIFASGSPFPPVEFGGRRFVPGQGNNAYVFPGVGLGAMASSASRVTEEMFFAAAKALVSEVSRADLDQGRIYPPLSRIREVSAIIAEAVAEIANNRGLARKPRPANLKSYIASRMYEPNYESLI